MKRICAIVVVVALLSACATQSSDDALPEPSLEKIADGVWIHKSYRAIEPWGPILSQGLVIQNEVAVYLIDTAWNDEDTNRLLDLVEAETGELPISAMVTHAHADKMGGVGALHKRGINTMAHAYANTDAPARNLIPTRVGMPLEPTHKADILDWSVSVEEGTWPIPPVLTAYYPGAGHTRDNIVVYYAPAKVLFGGCLIRPGDANSLGNTADGDVENWADAVRAVAEAFPQAEFVIPSHGPVGGRELLDHTIALAEAANE